MKSNAKTSTVDASSKFGALVASGALKASERHVAGAYDAEDRIAEGLAMTWVWFETQVALGREPEVRLTRHCSRMRTIDRSHRLDSGDRRRWAQDVYHQAGRNVVELRRLQFLEHEDDRVQVDDALGLAEAGCADPTEKLDSGLDLRHHKYT